MIILIMMMSTTTMMMLITIINLQAKFYRSMREQLKSAEKSLMCLNIFVTNTQAVHTLYLVAILLYARDDAKIHTDGSLTYILDM